MGGLADFFMFNSLIFLMMPIYNIGLGLDVFLVGLASGIPRILDAFTDTFVGNLSDNTRTRWGRRRPFIALGVLGGVIMFPLIWMPPFQTSTGIFLYLLVMVSVYFSFVHTIFVIPYTALGFEQTSDYAEKSRVLAWRMYIGLIGALTVPWVYKICLLDVFPNEVVGVRYVSLGIGLIILVTGLSPVFFCKEKLDHKVQARIKIRKALAETIRNKSFMRLMSAYVVVVLGIISGVGLTLYVNIYYLCDGDKSYAAQLVATAGSIKALAAYISLPLASWLSGKIGKHRTMQLGFFMVSIGGASYGFTLRPDFPELQFISAAIIGSSLQGCWLMVNSIIADICDEDEYITGFRREGFYAAVFSVSKKVSFGVASVFIGALLWLIGFDAQLANQGMLNSQVPVRLFYGFIFLPLLTPLAGVWILRTFPHAGNSSRFEATKWDSQFHGLSFTCQVGSTV